MIKKLIRITTVPVSLKYLLSGQMKFMQKNGFDVLMISADGKEIKDLINSEQCRHQIVPMTRKVTPWKDFKCLLQLIKIFNKEKPDIVHTHTPKAGLLGMLAAKFCRVKIRIHTVAGLPLMVETGFKYQLLKIIEKITYKAANHVWPNSNSLLQFIKHHHLTTDNKLEVIAKGSSNGINLKRFNKNTLNPSIIEEIKTSINYEKSNIYLLFIGRLVTDKGIVELVNVFTKMYQQASNLRLVLVGEYESILDPLPENTLSKINSNPGIYNVGWSNYVEYYMSVANIFIFPSHREGFPNVILQAGAMQLPIICSEIAGNIDIVTHKKTGLIFKSKNEEEMLGCIKFSLENINTVKEMATTLFQIITENYSRENIWQNILQKYKILLADK